MVLTARLEFGVRDSRQQISLGDGPAEAKDKAEAEARPELGGAEPGPTGAGSREVADVGAPLIMPDWTRTSSSPHSFLSVPRNGLFFNRHAVQRQPSKSSCC